MRLIRAILSGLFAFLALLAWAQVVTFLIGNSGDPSVLVALQAAIGSAAAATAFGSWRRAKWTAVAALIYGVVTSGMLVALPFLLHLPASARSGIWTGATAVFAVAVVCAIYFRADSRRRSNPRIGAALLFLLSAGAGEPRSAAAQGSWQPASGHSQIPIWPGVAPDAQPVQGAEIAVTVLDSSGNPRLVGGKPWTYVDRVSQPTMTLYSPARVNTGAAVVVFPGGGYNILAIDLEGSEVCDWLTSTGITCVLLKYRVPCEKTGPYRDCRIALEDAQRTMGLVRARAAQWHVDPHRIGVLGFSAGGHMVAALSTHFAKRLYRHVDAADTTSCRPDFAIALYPGHLASRARQWALNPDIRVTSRTPPTFLLQAEDDPVDPVENSIVYHAALRSAAVPVELHLYAKGGHAFGLRRTTEPITAWPTLAEAWLRRIGMLRATAPGSPGSR